MKKKQENIDEEAEEDLRFACSLNPPRSQPTDHSHTLQLHPRDCSVIQVTGQNSLVNMALQET